MLVTLFFFFTDAVITNACAGIFILSKNIHIKDEHHMSEHVEEVLAKLMVVGVMSHIA
jgi:hypothetical protein